MGDQTGKTMNPFAENKLNRFFGGSKSQTDPYISGFFLVFFNLPGAIFSSGAGDANKSGNSGQGGVETVLASSVLTAVNTGVTLPDYTMEKATVNALGGVKFHVPAALAVGDTLSLTFTEYSSLPVFNTILRWQRYIRSNVLGFADKFNSDYNGQGSYVQSSYKGSAIVVYMRPNMSAATNQIEFYCKCDGVWPTKVPTDGLAADIATVEKKDLTVDFSTDLVFFESWVLDEARQLVSGAVTGAKSYLDGLGRAHDSGGDIAGPGF